MFTERPPDRPPVDTDLSSQEDELSSTETTFDEAAASAIEALEEIADEVTETDDSDQDS